MMLKGKLLPPLCLQKQWKQVAVCDLAIKVDFCVVLFRVYGASGQKDNMGCGTNECSYDCCFYENKITACKTKIFHGFNYGLLTLVDNIFVPGKILCRK